LHPLRPPRRREALCPRAIATCAPPVAPARVDQQSLQPVSPGPQLAFIAVELLTLHAHELQLAFDIVERFGRKLASHPRITSLLKALP
jgi:hypothetical protein